MTRREREQNIVTNAVGILVDKPIAWDKLGPAVVIWNDTYRAATKCEIRWCAKDTRKLVLLVTNVYPDITGAILQAGSNYGILTF